MKAVSLLSCAIFTLSAQTQLDLNQHRARPSPLPAVIVVDETGAFRQAKLENVTLIKNPDGSYTFRAADATPPECKCSYTVLERIALRAGVYTYPLTYEPTPNTVECFINGVSQKPWSFNVAGKALLLGSGIRFDAATADAWVKYQTLDKAASSRLNPG